MRLRDIQVVLTENLPRLQALHKDTGGNQAILQNRNALEAALRAIAEIDHFRGNAKSLLNHEVIQPEAGLMVSNVVQSFVGGVHGLRQRTQEVKEFLDSVLPPAPELYFSVELPTDMAETTDQCSKALNTIHVAFDQPIRRLGFSPLKVTETESGSFIVELGVAAISSLPLLGGLIKLGIARANLVKEKALAEQERIKVGAEQERLKQEKARAEQEQAKAENERLDTELKKLEIQVKVIELEQRKIAFREDFENAEEQHTIARLHPDLDPGEEFKSVCELSIKSIMGLVEGGASFKLQLDAPRDVVDAFPTEARPVRLLGVKEKVVKQLLQNSPQESEAETDD